MIMRILAVILACAGFFCLAQAQVPMTGAGLGVPTVISGYTGPVDINGTAFAFWSTRCGATAYTGNVVDIWDGATGVTTETLVTCSSGGILNTGSPTALATTCAVSCVAKTVYDQSGSNKCTTACNVTQATLAKMPVITTSCQNSKICLVFTAANGSCLVSATVSAGQVQPFTLSATTNNTNSLNFTNGFDANNTVHFGTNGANTGFQYAGLTATITVSQNAVHAHQLLYNSSTSSWYLDGSANTGLNPFTQGIGTSGPMTLGDQQTCIGSGSWDGKWFELGIWNGDKTANNSTMNSNQHTYWSF